jgi:hypothetical protein
MLRRDHHQAQWVRPTRLSTSGKLSQGVPKIRLSRARIHSRMLQGSREGLGFHFLSWSQLCWRKSALLPRLEEQSWLRTGRWAIAAETIRRLLYFASMPFSQPQCLTNSPECCRSTPYSVQVPSHDAPLFRGAPRGKALANRAVVHRVRPSELVALGSASRHHTTCIPNIPRIASSSPYRGKSNTHYLVPCDSRRSRLSFATYSSPLAVLELGFANHFQQSISNNYTHQPSCTVKPFSRPPSAASPLPPPAVPSRRPMPRSPRVTPAPSATSVAAKGESLSGP